jgi:hypothetical protein
MLSPHRTPPDHETAGGRRPQGRRPQCRRPRFAVAALLMTALTLAATGPANASERAPGTDPAPATTQTRAAPSGVQPCDDVLLVMLNGSGALPLDQPDWRMRAVRDAAEPEVEQHGRALVPYTLPYAAMDVATLATPGGVDLYLSGLDGGVQLLIAELTTQNLACRGRQRFVLSGYSQGAVVIHQALQRLAVTAADRSLSVAERAQARTLLEHVDGVALIADGSRVAGTTVAFGSAARSSYGVVKLAIAAGKWSSPLLMPKRLPPRLNGRAFDVCAKGDVVCDYGVVEGCKPPACDPTVAFALGRQVHITQYQQEGALAGAALAAAARGFPLLRPSEVSITGRVGAALDVRPLEVVVEPGTALTWRLIGGPPGVRLTRGRLTGKPTRAGTFEATVRVTRGRGYGPSEAKITFAIAPRS